MFLLLSADLFSNNSLRNTIRVSNSLDPNKDQNFVGPDLGPIKLITNAAAKKERVNSLYAGIQRGEGQGVGNPLENHKNIGFLSNTGWDPLKLAKLITKPTFNVGPSSAHQQNAI